MVETLGRLMTKVGDTLKLRREARAHGAEMTRQRSLAAFGPDPNPFEIRHRERCTACPARGRSEVWI